MKTLSYFDVFEYPLTLQQIFATLPTNSITQEEVRAELVDMVEKKSIKEHEDFYFLSHQQVNLIEHRRLREEYAKKLIRRARTVAMLIKQFPFVRGIFLSGELSKNVADKQSDIDFFIVTAPHRLWVSRTLLILFKKIFLLNSKKYFCLNHFMAEDSLLLNNQNLFTAIETATVKVLWNENLLTLFHNENKWVNNYLPNWEATVEITLLLPSKRSALQKVAEFILEFLPLSTLDCVLMNAMKKIWASRYPQLPPHKLAERFKCSLTISTAYGHDFQQEILDEYAARLRMYDIQQ